MINDSVSSYTATSFQLPSAGFTITRTKNLEYEVVFQYEITLIIGINAGNMIYATITLPGTLQGQTEGLLGNFDNSDTNDFVSRDGTTLPDDATDMEIHFMFAQTCEYSIYSPLVHSEMSYIYILPMVLYIYTFFTSH